MQVWILGMLASALLVGSSAAMAQETSEARFRLDLNLAWEEKTYPVSFPQNPHFSRLIGATHNSRYALFGDGRTASSGLALVATNGRTSVLKAEIAEAMRRKRAAEPFEAGGLAAGVGTLSIEFSATEAHPFVSAVTMLAPSPDWFTGVADAPLRENGAWIEGAEIPLWVWDAGVDAGRDL